MSYFLNKDANPEIPLKDIILSAFLMPFFGLTSLLSLDREARKKQFKKLLGGSFPDLLLFDSLYFNKPHFDLVRKELHTHLLIKSSDPSFREVLQDADFFFKNKDMVDVPAIEEKGFDSERTCTWRIEIASGEFAGYPIQIAHLTEYYPKRIKNKNTEAWIVTTDLSLSSEELREAAHLRWQA